MSEKKYEVSIAIKGLYIQSEIYIVEAKSKKEAIRLAMLEVKNHLKDVGNYGAGYLEEDNSEINEINEINEVDDKI